MKSIEEAYGSLEQPNFDWVVPAHARLKRQGLVVDHLLRRFFVCDVSDLNSDVALHLHLRTGVAEFGVSLSCVRPWAMVYRVLQESQGPGLLVLEPGDDSLTAEERDLFSQLGAHGFAAMTREELLAPVPIRLFDTDPEDTRVYHALFSDSGTPPPLQSA